LNEFCHLKKKHDDMKNSARTALFLSYYFSAFIVPTKISNTAV